MSKDNTIGSFLMFVGLRTRLETLGWFSFNGAWHPIQGVLRHYDRALEMLLRSLSDDEKKQAVRTMVDIGAHLQGETGWASEIIENIDGLSLCARREELRKVRDFITKELLPALDSTSWDAASKRLKVSPKTIWHYYQHGYVKADAMKKLLEGICREWTPVAEIPMVSMRFRHLVPKVAPVKRKQKPTTTSAKTKRKPAKKSY